MIRNRVLVVEDDQSLQEFYETFFEGAHRNEFVWYLAKDGASALRILAQKNIDVVVLDWSLPDTTGLDVLRQIRSDPRTRTLTVFMVTAKSGDEDCASALESGADDYLAKPFKDTILLARLHSLQRRRQLAFEGRGFYELDELRYWPDSEKITLGSEEIHLHPKELGLLLAFLTHRDKILTPSVLWDLVWTYEGEPASWQHIVTVTVSSLRRKLGAWADRIEHRRSLGYILNCRILVEKS